MFKEKGADLAGSLVMKGKVNALIVLYTCAVNLRIQLALLIFLSAKALLLSFRRFSARHASQISFIATLNLIQLKLGICLDQLIDLLQSRKQRLKKFSSVQQSFSSLQIQKLVQQCRSSLFSLPVGWGGFVKISLIMNSFLRRVL